MTDTIKTAVITPQGVPVAVFGWLADTGACGHYRVIQPLKTMARKNGVQVEAGQYSQLPFTVLVAQRTHKEECVDFLEHIRNNRQSFQAAKAAVPVPKIVYELDDDLWSIERDNPGYEYYRSNNVLGNAIRAIELSDAVTVSTEPLADIVREYNENVFVVPNSIPNKYLNELRHPYSLGSDDKPFVMGWSGSATHLNDFRMCVPSLNTFLKFYPNSRMVFFGTDYSHLLDRDVRDQCRTAPWTSTVEEYLDLLSRAKIDVMLAPLSPSIFNESKSNLRLIEANAMGIPVVATDWGPYHFCVTDPSTQSPGVRYITPGTSWLPALTDLKDNPFTRLSMSTAGRMWVETHYLQENNTKKWINAYVEVLDQ